MYPKLRNDVYLTPLGSDGLTVAIDGRSHQIKGRHLYALLDRLIPFLDGEHSLTSIVAQLDQKTAHIVQTLLQQLHRVNAVRDDTENRAVEVAPYALKAYHASLSYLERFTPHARQALNQVLTRPVCIVGSGSVVRTLAPALWESGVRHGQIVLPEGDPLQAELYAYLSQAQDPHLNWRVVPRPEGQTPALTIVVGTPQEVKRAAQGPDLAGHRILPICISADFCSLGPVSPPSWTFMARLPFTPPPADTWNAYSVVGARAAIESFRILAGLPAPIQEQLLRIDNRTLADTLHDVQLKDPDALVDAFAGVMVSLDEEAIPQLPLYLMRARPRSGQGGGTGVGRTPAEARAATLLGALAASLPAQPAASGRWVRAWGRSPEEMVNLAALLQAERLAAQQPAHFTVLADPTPLLDPDGAHWWKTLTERYRQPLLAREQRVGSVSVVHLSGAQHQVTAAGFTQEGALKRALMRALARVQGGIEETLYPTLLDPGEKGAAPEPTPVVHLAAPYQALTPHHVWLGWVQVG